MERRRRTDRVVGGINAATGEDEEIRHECRAARAPTH
jgi:hypothetical protein